MLTMGAAGVTDLLQFRQILKERIRNANKESITISLVHSSSTETKNSSSSFFGPSTSSVSERMIEQSKVLMPELMNLLKNQKSNDDLRNPPTKATKPKSAGMDSKSERIKKMKDYRDYSFLMSETTETPKGSPKKETDLKSLLKADGNVLKPKKKTPDRNKLKADPKPQGLCKLNPPAKKTPEILRPKVSCVREKETSGINKSKASSSVSKFHGKDSLPASVSKNLKSSPPRENLVMTKPSAKEVMQEKKDTLLKKRKRVVVNKARAEEDEHVDVTSIIRDIFGGRGQRKYSDYGDDDGDDRAMVSGFNDILKEERRSAKIAREEDEIETLRLEQEKKAERLKKAKKQKLMN